ncbi:MAG: hypothetical protein JWN30_550 [Bacilli bacterium]|nr:hypothetical protein [Bacilli bacterium]
MNRFTKFVSKKTIAAAICGASIASFSLPAFAAGYQVQSGDSFWKIAHSNQVSLSSLEAANPGVNAMHLQVGQTLNLPGASNNSSSTYTVSGNDTFWTISKKLNVPLAALLSTNSAVNPSNLYPGIKLHLPGSQSGTTGQTSPAAQPVVSSSANQPLSYSRVISGTATAYTSSPAENGWGPVDYFGNPLKLGTVAVDPSVIPLGSKLYISGYNCSSLPTGGMIAYATDEGSAIKGTHIDMYLPTSVQTAQNFGIQNVKIYVLK